MYGGKVSNKKKQAKPRNHTLAVIAANDPTRFRDRTVNPEVGKGRKDRPRQKKWENEFDSYDSAA